MDFLGSLTLLFIVLAVEINFRSTQTKKKHWLIGSPEWKLKFPRLLNTSNLLARWPLNHCDSLTCSWCCTNCYKWLTVPWCFLMKVHIWNWEKLCQKLIFWFEHNVISVQFFWPAKICRHFGTSFISVSLLSEASWKHKVLWLRNYDVN